MNESEEQAYIQGSRVAWTTVLRECLRHLGYDSLAATQVNWITEREDAVTALRNLCRKFGDNDWPSNSHLGDVIEKHLARYLDEDKVQ